MNRIYRLHPREYALGETEVFYARMARKRLLLEKRGAYLSRFRKGTPENRKYRIELASPSLLDGETGLPEEQIQLYGECGWGFMCFPQRKTALRRKSIPTPANRPPP